MRVFRQAARRAAVQLAVVSLLVTVLIPGAAPATHEAAGMSLAEGLDALCARYGKVWWRDGDALFFAQLPVHQQRVVPHELRLRRPGF